MPPVKRTRASTKKGEVEDVPTAIKTEVAPVETATTTTNTTTTTTTTTSHAAPAPAPIVEPEHASESEVEIEDKPVAAATATTTATASESAVAGGKKRRRVKTNRFASYIFRTMRGIDTDIGMTKKSVEALDSFVVDLFDKLAAKMIHLQHVSGRPTATIEDLHAAFKLLLPKELCDHVIKRALLCEKMYNDPKHTHVASVAEPVSVTA